MTIDWFKVLLGTAAAGAAYAGYRALKPAPAPAALPPYQPAYVPAPAYQPVAPAPAYVQPAPARYEPGPGDEPRETPIYWA